MHKPIFKDVELAIRSNKEKLKRNKLGSNARKFRKQHSWPQIKKVDGDVVTLSNNTFEYKNGETSTKKTISLIED